MVRDKKFHRHTAYTSETFGGLKPDLVKLDSAQPQVIDIAVCGENYFDHTYNDKVTKYFNLCFNGTRNSQGQVVEKADMLKRN